MHFARLVLLSIATFATDRASAQNNAQVDSFIPSWLAMVTRIQDEQPRWITPVAVTTPRLEQEFRFDVFSETLSNHSHLTNYGAGKGLEFIPAENMQISIGLPPYETRTSNSGKKLAAGWADWPAFLLKY